MARILFSIILCLSISLGLMAQSPIGDSTAIKNLIEKAESIADTNIRAALPIFKEAKALSKSANLPLWRAKALYAENNYYYDLLDYEAVIRTAKEAAALFAKEGLTIDESKCYNRIGLALMYLNKHQRSLQAYFKALELAESQNDDYVAANIYNNIGIVYEVLEDWDNAMKYAQLALDKKIKGNNKKGMASSYNNIANLYYNQDKFEEAIPNFKLSIKLWKELEDDFEEARLKANLANTLAEMGQTDVAIQYLDSALAFQDTRKEQMMSEWCISIAGEANAWFKKGDLKKTAYYLDKCEACEEGIVGFTFIKAVYNLKSEYYKKTGNYKQSLKYLELANIFRDSIYKESQVLENQKIALRYELNKKVREDALQYQLNISEQEIATATYKNRMYLLLVALLIAVALGLIYFNKAKRIQEKKRKQSLETMRTDIARDLHDDIGSTLSSIQIIGSLALNQCEDNPQLKESVSRISELTDKVSDGIREIVWSVNPAHDKLGSFASQLRKMAADILGANEISFEFKEKIKDPEMELLPQQRKNLLMIYKEALNNARKYSGTERVYISIKQNFPKLTIKIKDYGCGFDLEKIQKGNGLNNIERRAAEIDAQLEIKSKVGEGTFVSVKIPLP